MQPRYTIDQINKMMEIVLYVIQDFMPSAANLIGKIQEKTDINTVGDLLVRVLTPKERVQVFPIDVQERKIERSFSREYKTTYKGLESNFKTLFWHLRRGSPVTTAKLKRDNAVGIIYLDEKERSCYKLNIQKGEFSFPDEKLSNTHFLLFGLDGNKDFYGKLGFEWKNYGNGFFGHGSFKAGGYLIGSGELYIVEGRLKYISSNSGHYLPVQRHMRMTLYNLYKQGVDLSEVLILLYHHVRIYPHTRGRYVTSDCYNALEFLEKHEKNCKNYNDKKEAIKKEIQTIRAITNAMIALPDSKENLKPHRLIKKR